jgi:hypothetical protein
MDERLEFLSRYWLKKRYELSALGEGEYAYYDDAPRCRTDAFDCETYVDTVLALAFATDVPSFKQCMDNIRYENGTVSFITRNHFTSIDWNVNNQKQGFLKDITTTLTDEKHHPVARITHTIIDKKHWYQHLPSSRVRLRHASSTEKEHRLKKLQQEGRVFRSQDANLPYIPLTSLFDKEGHTNLALFKQIPNASIVEIVRPNWDLTNIIGTHLDISHLGFVFWKENQPHFLQASSIYQQVVDVPLIDYLRDAYQNTPSIGGINIQIVVPKKPLGNGCH